MSSSGGAACPSAAASACPSVAAAAAGMAQLAAVFERRLERHGRLGRYTLQEVAKHCSPDDAWVVVAGKVRGEVGSSSWLSARQLAGAPAPTSPALSVQTCADLAYSPPQVYDITRHVLEHPGWQSGCGTSQLLAILRTLGTDCSEEVFMVSEWRESGLSCLPCPALSCPVPTCAPLPPSCPLSSCTACPTLPCTDGP